MKNLMPSIEKQVAKAGESSPQKTVNKRRLIALELTAEALDNLLKVQVRCPIREYLTINLFHFTTVKPDGIMYLQVKC